MLPYLSGIVLIVLSVSLQGAWPAWLRMAGQPPDFVVAVVVAIALRRGATEGCIAGLIAAVVYAGAMHHPLGGLAAAYMVVGTAAGLLRGSLLSERLEVAVLVTAVAVLVAGIIRMIFVPPAGIVIWLKTMLWCMLYTAAASPVVFWASAPAGGKETAS